MNNNIDSLQFTGRLDINNNKIYDEHIVNIIKNDEKIYTGEIVLYENVWYVTDNITKYKLCDYDNLELIIHKSNKSY